MAFRVEMGADAVTKPHFHEVDQYQVFLAGRGRFGRHEIATLGVHYADHHSAYGPIVAGASGFAYLTLRPRQDSRIIYVDEPGSRERRVPSKKRQYTIADVNLSIEPVMAERDAPGLDPIIESQPDGLEAWVLRLGTGMSASVPDSTPSGGAYVYAANGSFIAGSGACPARSLMWFGPDDRVTVTAGDAGLEALLLRFPRAEQASAAAPASGGQAARPTHGADENS